MRAKTAHGRKRARERKASEFARKYHSKERVQFFHGLGCAICGRRSEVAHLGNEGLGRKSHYTRTVPLCSHHHRTGKYALDKMTQAAFEDYYGIDLDAVALRAQQAFEGPQGELYAYDVAF